MPPASKPQHPERLSAPLVLRFSCPACDKNLRTQAKPTARTVRCPSCREALTVPGIRPAASAPPAVRLVSLSAVLILVFAVVGCAIYSNLGLLVKDRAYYRYFPPFLPNVNGNSNPNLGGEYFNIAQALAAGKGFANPFRISTGPTAWQPPILPGILAGLLWISDGSRAFVATVIVCLSVLVLIGTGLLVQVLARQTTTRVGAGLATLIFLLAMLCQFNQYFQRCHDGWIVMSSLGLLLAGLCWVRPLCPDRPAGRLVLLCAGWGMLGGFCTRSARSRASAGECCRCWSGCGSGPGPAWRSPCWPRG